MTSVRGMSLAPFVNPVRGRTARTSRVRPPLLIAAAIVVAALIADAVLIAVAAPSAADLGALYLTSI
jgi:hypothetical protein